MRKIIYSVFIIILSLMACFCVFGFVATFEPVEHALMFRIGYAAMGALSFSGAVFMLIIGCRKSR
jgi:hypothetical protein